MLHFGKKTFRQSWGRLAALLGLVCSLSFLAAGLAPENAAAAMYLITENGYQLITNRTFQTEDPAAAADNSQDLLLSDGQEVTVHQNGTLLSTIAKDETVTVLLDRLGVQIGPMDMISVDLRGQQVEITIASELIFYERVMTAAPHQITYVDDPFLPEGTEILEQQGFDGIKTEIYEVICHAGQVTNKHLIEAEEENVVHAVIRRGVGQAAPVVDIRTAEDGSGTLVLAGGTELPFSEARLMKATAYTAGDPGVGTKTATGTTVRVGTVAVDPKVIPYGTKMFILSNDGKYVYGFAVAEDCGGAIRQDRIDLYYDTHSACVKFGRRDCTVYMLAD